MHVKPLTQASEIPLQTLSPTGEPQSKLYVYSYANTQGGWGGGNKKKKHIHEDPARI